MVSWRLNPAACSLLYLHYPATDAPRLSMLSEMPVNPKYNLQPKTLIGETDVGFQQLYSLSVQLAFKLIMLMWNSWLLYTIKHIPALVLSILLNGHTNGSGIRYWKLVIVSNAFFPLYTPTSFFISKFCKFHIVELFSSLAITCFGGWIMSFS